MCLAAVLHPDSLGELQRSPGPLAAIGGGVLLLRGREGRGRKGIGKGGDIEWRGEEWEGRGEGREREGEKRRGEGKGRGLPHLYLTSGYGPGRS